MRNLELETLKDFAVYPGHPVVVAFLIMKKYQNLAEATKTGHSFPHALEDNDIPGAGGNIYSALSLLAELKEGKPLGKTISKWCDQWISSKAGGLEKYVEPGDSQAKLVIPQFSELAPEWIKK